MHDLLSLACEEHKDCEQKTDERPWCGEPEEDFVIPPRTYGLAECKASEDGKAKEDPEEDGHRFRNCAVFDVQGTFFVGDEFDEKEG